MSAQALTGADTGHREPCLLRILRGHRIEDRSELWREAQWFRRAIPNGLSCIVSLLFCPRTDLEQLFRRRTKDLGCHGKDGAPYGLHTAYT